MSQFEVRNTQIPGCLLLQPRVFVDARGTFVKTFHRPSLADLGIALDFAEEYYSISGPGVLRGLHFQTPPHDHAKMVYCVEGEILDAVVDLRRGSPTFGQFATFVLSGRDAGILCVPSGLAHGFLVKQGPAIVMYKVSTVYAPEHDKGILWSSAGVPWGVENPVLSARDASFPPLRDYASPFQYGG